MRPSTTLPDPVCRYCYRPVIGPAVYGQSGAYHPACVQPPSPGIDWRKAMRVRLSEREAVEETFRRFGIDTAMIDARIFH